MLEEKEFRDVVDRSRFESTIVAQTKKRDKDNAISSKIIKQGVNLDLYINVIREHIPHQS